MFADSGQQEIAIDADPDVKLAATLGFPNPQEIIPVSEMKNLIDEWIAAHAGQPAPYFTFNLKVDDIPGKFASTYSPLFAAVPCEIYQNMAVQAWI